MYWSVGHSHTTVGACRRLLPFTSCLLPVSVHVPLATTVEKLAKITRYSHIASRNAWLGRTTVRLHGTASACNYCIHYHASLIPPRTSTPGTHAIQLAITRSLCDGTTQVRYYFTSPHPGTSTINCYFRGTGSPRSRSRRWGCVASKTENSSTWYAIPGTWCIIWLLLCCCCRCL